MINEEYRECYICGYTSEERHMTIMATGDYRLHHPTYQLWWCNDAEWCRSRAAANKLEDDGFITYGAPSKPDVLP